MPANDVFEMNVNWALGVQTFTNVLHFRQISADGTGDARAAVAGAMVDDIQAKWLLALSSDTDLIGYAVRRLYPIQTQQLDVAINTPGTGGSDAISPNIAALIALYGEMSGRKGVGRIFVSGMEEDHVTSGSITSAGRALLNTLQVALVEPIVDVSSGYTFQLGIWDSTASLLRDVLKATVRFRMSNLRSRTLSLA